MMLKRFNGQSIVEVVLTVSIVSLILMSVVSLVSNSIRLSTFSKNQTAAQNYNKELSEWLRRRRDVNWNELRASAQTSTNWCMISPVWTSPTKSSTCIANDYISGQTLFVRDLVFSCFYVTNLAKTVVDCSGAGVVNTISYDIVTSWIDSSGKHSVLASGTLTNWSKP